MSAPDHRSPLARYRDAVTELLEAGTPFAEIENAIGRLRELNENERSALWLFAFFSTDRDRRSATVRPRLSSAT